MAVPKYADGRRACRGDRRHLPDATLQTRSTARALGSRSSQAAHPVANRVAVGGFGFLAGIQHERPTGCLEH